jgi:hypothetical protein
VIPEAAWAAVPTEDPADSPQWVAGVAASAEFSDRERRAYSWVIHLLARLTGQAMSTAIAGLVLTQPERFESVEVLDVSAGFIPHSPRASGGARSHRDARLQFDAPGVEVDGLNYSFGVVVIGVAGPRDAPRESSGDNLPLQIVGIDGLPVVAEFREVSYSAPPSPSGAMSACYARPRASKRFFGPVWSDGIVIARHSLSSLGFSTGVSVPMASGGSCTVADIDDGTTIDAAILDCGMLPTGISPLRLAPAVPPGANVTVRTAAGGFSAQVLRIHDHPSYFGNMVAHRVFLDTVGTGGDSGSLVTRSPHGDSAGIYMGSTGGSVPEGLAQSMRQVVQYFDVDLFD